MQWHNSAVFRARETGLLQPLNISKHAQNPTYHMIASLTQTHTLQRHSGCVNRIVWNHTGTLLASVSDDTKLVIWDVLNSLDRHETITPKITIDTAHRKNVFGVAFLDTDNERFATGAMDGMIITHHLSRPEATKIYSCHNSRVKNVEAKAHLEPFVFWSASEDGTIRQFDERIQHSCSGDCNDVFIDMRSRDANGHPDAHGWLSGLFFQERNASIMFKDLDINPVFPNYMATACSDQFIRIFDRRMVRAGNENNRSIPAMELSPNYLAEEKSSETLHATYVQFSPDGSQLVASYNSEHAYLFDMYDREGFSLEGLSNDQIQSRRSHSWVYSLKEMACDHYSDGLYSSSIAFVDDAMKHEPRDKSLLVELIQTRYLSYMERAWKGDLHLAKYDCENAIALDPDNTHHRYFYIMILQKLDLNNLAKRVGKAYQRRFPEIEGKIDDLFVDRVEDELQDDEEEMIESEFEFCDKRGFAQRFCGHCNVETDIKEICFFSNGRFVVSGSDDGSIAIWETRSGRLINVLYGGMEIVNCVRPNPHQNLLVTSGIESIIRLYQSGDANYEQEDFDSIAEENAHRLGDGDMQFLEITPELLYFLVSRAEHDE